MKTLNKITLSKIDKERLFDLLPAQQNNTLFRDNIRLIEEKFNIGRILNPMEIPPDVVTMNSRVEVKNLSFRKTIAVELVYPGAVDAQFFKISIFSPLGAAMLGYAQGDEFTWKGKSTKNRFVIEKIIYQPESAGDYHL